MLDCGLNDRPGIAIADRQNAVGEVLGRGPPDRLGNLRIGLALHDTKSDSVGHSGRLGTCPTIEEGLEQRAAVQAGYLQRLGVNCSSDQRIGRHGRVNQQSIGQAAPLECCFVLRDIHEVRLHPIAEGPVDLQQLATHPPKKLLKPAPAIGGQFLPGKLIADVGVSAAQVGLELFDLASLESLKQYRVAADLLQQLLVRRLLRFRRHRLCPG